MTLKEAMLKIESFCSYYDSEVGDALRVLAKGVEVLEILQPRITLKDSQFHIVEVTFIEASGFVFTDSRDHKLLKEWLKGK